MKKYALFLIILVMFSVIGYSQITITQNSSLLKEPSLTSKVITTAFNGDSVTLIEHTGKFWKVDYQKKTGYIHETCLSNYIAPSQKEPDKTIACEQIQEKPQSVTDKTVSEKTTVGQIELKKGVYCLNDKPLKNKELKKLLKSNSECIVELRTYQMVSAIGLSGQIIVSVIGIATLDPVLSTVFILGGLAANIGFTALFGGPSLKKAIEIYNKSLESKNPITNK